MQEHLFPLNFSTASLFGLPWSMADPFAGAGWFRLWGFAVMVYGSGLRTVQNAQMIGASPYQAAFKPLQLTCQFRTFRFVGITTGGKSGTARIMTDYNFNWCGLNTTLLKTTFNVQVRP